MTIFEKLHKLIIGSPRNPLHPEAQKHIALIAFLAWVGLGADGLSSSCYGPEESFVALGIHTHMALYIAFAMTITVFVISLAYNQVIELFPSGGGGYKVATQLLGSYAGLVSGAALIVDYVLTIALSAAAGIDAVFSLLPPGFQVFKLFSALLVVMFLIVLNLRGMKESIKILLPIFLGFMLTHIAIISYGIIYHINDLPSVLNETVNKTHSLADNLGWFFVLALFIRSYSLGSGTYTGIEAVSNNVNRLAEPRVATGKWTMLYMAISLSFTAGGIILLYLLWNATPTPDKTLNAVVFGNILGNSLIGHSILILTLALEGGLLLVAANTGFLAGPSVFANMAVDNWVPNRFRHLSSRLVTQNGVLLFGAAALIILLWSHGKVSWLVVLYSMNVFLTFSMSILGLCVYWWKHKKSASKNWLFRLIFSMFAFCITGSILIITLISKFSAGGWVTVVITGTVIILCLSIKMHYQKISRMLEASDRLLHIPLKDIPDVAPALDPTKPTAVLLVGKYNSVGIHTLLWVLRMFPNHFKNIIFIGAGIVDVESFSGKDTLDSMQKEVDSRLNYFVRVCHQRGIAAEAYSAFGTDVATQLTELAEKISQKFPNSIFFATKLTFDNDNWITRWLHNETAFTLQRRLHLRNMQLVILPMRLG